MLSPVESQPTRKLAAEIYGQSFTRQSFVDGGSKLRHMLQNGVTAGDIAEAKILVYAVCRSFMTHAVDWGSNGLEENLLDMIVGPLTIPFRLVATEEETKEELHQLQCGCIDTLAVLVVSLVVAKPNDESRSERIGKRVIGMILYLCCPEELRGSITDDATFCGLDPVGLSVYHASLEEDEDWSLRICLANVIIRLLTHIKDDPVVKDVAAWLGPHCSAILTTQTKAHPMITRWLTAWVRITTILVYASKDTCGVSLQEHIRIISLYCRDRDRQEVRLAGLKLLLALVCITSISSAPANHPEAVEFIKQALLIVTDVKTWETSDSVLDLINKFEETIEMPNYAFSEVPCPE